MPNMDPLTEALQSVKDSTSEPEVFTHETDIAQLTDDDLMHICSGEYSDIRAGCESDEEAIDAMRDYHADRVADYMSSLMDPALATDYFVKFNEQLRRARIYHFVRTGREANIFVVGWKKDMDASQSGIVLFGTSDNFTSQDLEKVSKDPRWQVVWAYRNNPIARRPSMLCLTPKERLV